MKEYTIKKINRSDCELLLSQFHYLSKSGFSFKSGLNYGLFLENSLIGVAIFNGLSVSEISKGCFGLERDDQDGLFELGRLAINPKAYEPNLTSWFLSRVIRMLRNEKNVRAILTYADASLHNGYIYQALSFKYYGLTTSKKDFYILQENGDYKKHQRGKVKGLVGEWWLCTRKHRYLLIYDKRLICRWVEEYYPKGDNKAEYNRW